MLRLIFFIFIMFQVLMASAGQDLDSLALKVPFEIGRDPKKLLAVEEMLAREYKGNTYAKAIGLNLQGIYYAQSGQPNLALQQHLQALPMVTSLNKPLYLGLTYNYIGIAYLRSGAMLEASANFDKALRIFEQCGSRDNYLSALNNQASAYYISGNHKQALAALREVLQAEGISHKSKAIAYVNIGNVYEVNQADSAVYYARLAIQEFTAADRPSGVADALRLIGSILYNQKKYDQALNSYEQADSVNRKTNIAEIQVHVLCGKVKALTALKQVERAQKTLLELENYLATMDKKPLIYELELLKSKSSFLKLKGQDREALELMERVLVLNDSAQLAQSRAQLLELETIYSTERKSRQIEFLKEQNERERSRSYLIISLISIGFLFLLFVVLYLREKGRRQKIQAIQQEEWLNLELARKNLEEIQLKEKLEAAERQLLNKALSISEHNEFLAGLEQKIGELGATEKSQEDSRLNSLKNYIRNRLSGTEDWTVFLSQFEKVNQGFFERLHEKHPGLTLNEQRLCALARLRLNIKECANILHISPDSVKMARYRLKKKMQLQAEVELDDHLHQV